jgi:hypothetical protein
VRLTLRPVLVALLLVAVACCSALVPRYIVTTAPIDVGVRQGWLCMAVDPADPRGVCWWEPGESGCSSRSTGPGVFRAGDATVVTRTESANIEVGFRLGLHGDSTMPSFVDAPRDSRRQHAGSGYRRAGNHRAAARHRDAREAITQRATHDSLDAIRAGRPTQTGRRAPGAPRWAHRARLSTSEAPGLRPRPRGTTQRLGLAQDVGFVDFSMSRLHTFD